MGIQFYFVNRQTPLFIIMLRIAAFAALVAVAVAMPAGPPAPYHAPAPAYAPAPYHPAPHKAPVYDESPKPYAFQYGVADHYSGYIADVKYEGTPVYPEAKPYHPAPKPG